MNTLDCTSNPAFGPIVDFFLQSSLKLNFSESQILLYAISKLDLQSTNLVSSVNQSAVSEVVHQCTFRRMMKNIESREFAFASLAIDSKSLLKSVHKSTGKINRETRATQIISFVFEPELKEYLYELKSFINSMPELTSLRRQNSRSLLAFIYQLSNSTPTSPLRSFTGVIPSRMLEDLFSENFSEKLIQSRRFGEVFKRTFISSSNEDFSNLTKMTMSITTEKRGCHKQVLSYRLEFKINTETSLTDQLLQEGCDQSVINYITSTFTPEAIVQHIVPILDKITPETLPSQLCSLIQSTCPNPRVGSFRIAI